MITSTTYIHDRPFRFISSFSLYVRDILERVTNNSCAYLYYKVRRVCVCWHRNVPILTSPPVFKLWDTQGYLWLPYDLMEVINLIGETFEPKKIIFFKKNTLCHSFRIIVILSIQLSFLPNYYHSFVLLYSRVLYYRIIVIPSVLVSSLPNPKLVSFLPN